MKIKVKVSATGNARQMKESGYRSIGAIPLTWKLCKIKQYAEVFTGNSIKDDQKDKYTDANDAIPYISTKDIDASLQRINYENGLYVKANDLTFKRVAEQSTLLCIEGGSAGKKVAFTNRDVCCVNKLCCLHSDGYHNKYLYYYVLSSAFKNQFDSHISGLIGGVSVNQLKNFIMPFPPYDEQERIATFLDVKCFYINSVIEKTRESIEEYKKLKQSIITEAVTKGIRPNREMKDSGIDWIGTIPANWGVQRIKTIFSLRNERNYEALEDVNLISLYTDLGVVQHDDLEKTSGNKASNADGYKKVKEDDIVVNIILCWMGAVGRSNFDGVTSPAYDVYIPSDSVNSRFYHHYFRTSGFGGDCYKRGKGIMAMRWRTYSDQFRDIRVVVPPLAEQKEILSYLDKRTLEIDNLLLKKQQFINELEDFKRALIYEYVTGKKEVPSC